MNPYSDLTADSAMYMLYNAGRTEVMQLSGFGENGAPSYSTDGTELFNKSDIYYGEGIMQSDGLASIYEAEATMDIATVDGVNYALKGRDVRHLLGSKIKFLYKKEKKTNDRTFLYGWPDPVYDNTLTLNASDLAIYDSAYSSTNIVYYNENDKKEEAKITSIPTVVYNFDMVPVPELERHWKIKSGSMRLIDNDRDDIYDVAIIEEYTNMFVVGNADSYTFMSGKYGNTLDLTDCDILKIYKNGKEISQNNIGSHVMISYIANKNGKKIFIYVNEAKFTGTVSSTRTKHGRTYYTIDGTEYEIADSFLSVTPAPITIQNGRTYKIWLDAEGNIAEIQNAEGDLRYALLVDIEDYDVDRENSVYLRLIMTDGSDTKVTVKDKLIFDGTKMTAKAMVTNSDPRSKLFKSNKPIEQVIKISFKDDGTVKEIDIAKDNTYASYTGNYENYYGYDDSEFTLDVAPISASQNNGTAKEVVVEYVGGQRIIDNKWVIAKATPVFCKMEGGGLEPEWNVQAGTDAVTSSVALNLKLYDTDPVSRIPAIGYKAGSTRENRFMTNLNIVEDIEWVYEDGEELKKIYLYMDGVRTSYVELYRGAIPDSIKKGDVVKRALWNNRLSDIEAIGVNLIEDKTPFVNGPLNGKCTVFATIYSRSEMWMMVVPPDELRATYGPFIIFPFNPGERLPVALYDREEESVTEVDSVALEQIVAPNSDGSLPDGPDKLMVVLRLESRKIMECIVVK